MPKVSVIVPNYNHAPYLDERIDSIIGQTCADFELIILDDCSTDNSREVIGKYANHPKVSQVIFNQANSGSVFKQWQKGIGLAQGEYIWIAESDDWCEANLLQVLVDAIDANPRCVMAYVQSYAVADDGRIEKISSDNKLAQYVNGREYIRKYLTQQGCPIWNAGMLLFKKSAYLTADDEFTTFRMCGDWMLYTEMAKQGDVFISGRTLNYFRQHGDNTSVSTYNAGKNYQEELRILRRIRDDGFITIQEYKAHLLFKYVRYMVYRHKFSAEVKFHTEAQFYENSGMKNFLELNGTLTLLRIKAKRRLNLVLDKLE
jgi:glycosyltransferase involved in cell wall biosynthesis